MELDGTLNKNLRYVNDATKIVKLTREELLKNNKGMFTPETVNALLGEEREE